MEVGFTGTRKGMSERQKEAVLSLLSSACLFAEVLHHGDCIGADKEAHDLMLGLNKKVVIHPPSCRRYRAFCKGADFTHEETDYFSRNRSIVNHSKLVIACPFDNSGQGGTWYTINYAKKIGKDVVIILPNGHWTFISQDGTLLQYLSNLLGGARKI